VSVSRKPELGPIQLLYKTPYEQLVQRDADFGKYQKRYFVTVAKRRAAVVAEKAGRLLLVSQYRLLVNRHSWEIPGGAVGKRETPKTAAERECLEEAGVACFDLQPLIFFHPSLDTVLNPTYIFYTNRCRERQTISHKGEETLFRWFPREQCLKMVLEGDIRDSLSIAGLLSYFVRRPELVRRVLNSSALKINSSPFRVPKGFMNGSPR
jgi:8-oxo-dGTP pyrophosphatase MutT (NUDIX family)